MRKLLNIVADNTGAAVVVYFAIQILISVSLTVPFESDSSYYYHLAQSSIALHSFYPAVIHLKEDFIVAPLYINLLIIVLSIYNSQFSIYVMNILLNGAQIYLVYKIASRLFNENCARISVLVYLFYLGTFGLVFMNLTELLFGDLVLMSIYFFYKKKFLFYFISGLFAAASIAVRPVGFSLLSAILIYLFWGLFKSKKNLKNLFAVITGAAIFIILFGLFTQNYCGKFIYTSTNGPVNILIGANNNASGAYNANVFEKGKAGYIENSGSESYIQKEDYWKKQALDWIKSNPVKWISLMPLKIIHIFIWDDYSLSNLFGMNKLNLYRMVKAVVIEKDFNLFRGYPFYVIFPYLSVQILYHIYYFALVIIFILTIVKKSASTLFNSKYLVITLFVISGLIMNLITFGNPRFKYPYFIFLIIAVSPAITNYIKLLNPFKNKID